MMRNKILRFGVLLMALAMLLCLIPSCQKHDPAAANAFVSLTLDEKGDEVTATVTLNAETVEKHAGTRAFLYELKPGDTIASLADRDPLDNTKIKSRMTFEFPLRDGTRSRIYSSFAIVFNDGSVMNVGGFHMIDNPSALATDTSTFPWQSSMKGLAIDNADDATALGVMHAMIEVKLSELANGAELFDFHGVNYAISATTLARLDQKIRSASEAGMQVSLSIREDVVLPAAYLAALTDYTVSRYTQSEHGKITAIFLEKTEAITTAQLATATRYAYMALTSRVANGRVFVTSDRSRLSEALAFFDEISLLLASNGTMSWGVSVKPSPSKRAPWEDPETQDMLLVTNMDKVMSYMSREASGLKPSWYAMSGVSYSSENEELQAASFAYAYYALQEDGVHLAFYQSQSDEVGGLYSQNGTPRRILPIFSSIDTGLKADDIRLCRETVGTAWSNLRITTNRQLLTGVAASGYDTNSGDVLFDFTTGETYAFTGVGTTAAPVSHPSSAWNSPTLYSMISASSIHSAGGVRKILTDASALENAASISLQTLTQSKSAEKTAITLTLEGVDSSGARLTYRSTVQAQNGEWQAVTFRINSFVSEADLSMPVVMTVSTSPSPAGEEDFAFWVKDIWLAKLAKDNSALVPIIVIPTCVLISIALLLAVYIKFSGFRFIRKREKKATKK